MVENYIRRVSEVLLSSNGALYDIGEVRYEAAPYDNAKLSCKEGNRSNFFNMQDLLKQPGARDAVIALHNKIYPVSAISRMMGTNVPEETSASKAIENPIATLCNIAKKSTAPSP